MFSQNPERADEVSQCEREASRVESSLFTERKCGDLGLEGFVRASFIVG